MKTADNLMDTLASPENLLAAWRVVRGNIPRFRRERSAGPDGVTLADFERDLPAQLSALRHMLLKGRYQPQPPGVISLPKRSGGTRQIGVLNIADRVVQRAAQQTIEPIYEPLFLPCSFGFRPGRSTRDAIVCARRMRLAGYRWAVDGDIEACFDSLDHTLLLNRLEKRILDRRVLALIQTWLSGGVLQHGAPEGKHAYPAQGLHKALQTLQHGMEWAMGTIASDTADPYSTHRFPIPDYGPPATEYSGDWDGQEEIPALEGIDYYAQLDQDEAGRCASHVNAVRQITASGVLLGTSLARRGLSKAGLAALGALKTPAGRLLLKRGALMGGGALGAAAGVAVAGYLVYRNAAPSGLGVLQGSPLSPLLAHIYLHPFDVSLTKAGFRLVRFADDWVVLCPDQHSSEAAYNDAVKALAGLHLKVNPEKTRILSPTDRLEWLGEVVG
jgi:RNA-directed DNA polymerase